MSTAIMFIIAISLGYIILFVDNNIRYVIGCGIATLSVIIALTVIKSKEPLIGEPNDERDQANIDRSGSKTIQLMNYFLAFVVFVCLTIYGVTKNQVYLTVALVELPTVIILLLLSLTSQSYYEKINKQFLISRKQKIFDIILTSLTPFVSLF